MEDIVRTSWRHEESKKAFRYLTKRNNKSYFLSEIPCRVKIAGHAKFARIYRKI